jgi:hypothetical protein
LSSRLVMQLYFYSGLSLKRLNALFVKLENTRQDPGLQDSVTHIFIKHNTKVTPKYRKNLAITKLMTLLLLEGIQKVLEH